MLLRILFLLGLCAMPHFAQPAIEPGVSHELAKWRAARYSDVRYKLNLTLEKMSPVLKGTIEIRLKLLESPALAGGQKDGSTAPTIILDWRKIKGHEEKSTINNISVNGKPVSLAANWPPADAGGSDFNEHLIFRDGVVLGENVIKLDFTSPILTTGSAITRYVDKEDGVEYIYSLFVPSDASTAFPVFDQPDLKAKFKLSAWATEGWRLVSNGVGGRTGIADCVTIGAADPRGCLQPHDFAETKAISTYVFAFAAGLWEKVSVPGAVATGAPRRGSGNKILARRETSGPSPNQDPGTKGAEPKRPKRNSGARITLDDLSRRSTSGYDLAPAVQRSVPVTSVYVRRSQAAKFKPHAAEVFRLNREAIKYLEEYFDYKFPFPKYDLVLIPEFPFGGMEHAGATFLREDRIIFPQEPTKNDYITRANLMFHEAAHQWFGDTVTMKWFDDLWLKEGFAEFMAYKTLEKVMPEYNAWKVFYERNKQAAYLTDSTKGTTPIYQEIANLNAAKSAYGNIVYRKAPSFLKQAEFYIGADNFQKAVRSLLKKHEFANAGWEDLVTEFETASGRNLKEWASSWVKVRSLPKVEQCAIIGGMEHYGLQHHNTLGEEGLWSFKVKVLLIGYSGERDVMTKEFQPSVKLKSTAASIVITPCPNGVWLYSSPEHGSDRPKWSVAAVMPNYLDYGYGIFLPDRSTKDYILKNIHTEKDDFLRTMMWGSLWDSVREAELDPKQYVELVVKNLSTPATSQNPKRRSTTPAFGDPSYPGGEQDESTIQTLLGRVSTAMRYYIDPAGPQASLPASAQRAENSAANRAKRPANARQAGSLRSEDLQTRVEAMLIENMQNASTPGQRITYYRAFLNLGSSPNARRIMKIILRGNAGISAGKPAAGKMPGFQPRTKDLFDIVTRLMVLGDPEAPKLLADLEKTETSDEAKRYAYAARAGLATPANKAKYWNDFVNNKDISESWIEAAFGPWNSTSHSELTLPYLERALKELPNHKRNRKIFFVNGWLGAFIGGQRSEEALAIVNKFLSDNQSLDRDLRLKILENVDLIERAVKIRARFGRG